MVFNAYFSNKDIKYRFTFIKDTIKNTNMYRFFKIFIISIFIFNILQLQEVMVKMNYQKQKMGK